MEHGSFSVKVHDRHHLEWKLVWPLERSRRRDKIGLEVFLFLPQSLRIRRDTYSRTEFYEDLTTYTRYGSPDMPFAEILDKQNPLSPLTRVARQRTEQPDLLQRRTRVSYELRVLMCIVRGRMSKDTLAIRRLLTKAREAPTPDQGMLEEAARLTRVTLENTRHVLERVRELKREYAAPASDSALMRAFEFTDEGLSLECEERCAKLYRAGRPALSKPGEAPEALSDAWTALREMIEAESRHRRQACYPSQPNLAPGVNAALNNERWLYRRGALKKYAQSTLYLSLHQAPGSRSILSALYAGAAMIAMLAFVLTLWFLRDIAPMNSLPYLVLAVIAYAFKDRIKEGLRSYFSERMTGFLRDREGQLLDRGPTRRGVGETSEAFVFVDEAKLPEDVQHLRNRDEISQAAALEAPESVLKYQKQLVVHLDRVFAQRERVTELNELMRLSVQRFLYHMDDAQKVFYRPYIKEAAAPGANFEANSGSDALSAPVPALSPQQVMKRGRARKTYHVNIIVRATGPGLPKHGRLQRFRVILSRDGIERIEHPPRPEKM